MTEDGRTAPRLTLVLGGVRSGKSAWAADLAAAHAGPVLFVATATPSDDEMADRIAAHRATRPQSWRTVEEPLSLAGAVGANARAGDVVLVDCLTVWLGNALVATAGDDPDAVDRATWARIEAAAIAAIEELTAAARAAACDLIVVSNEVGMGLVPPYPLGRAYRDALGRVNCRVAVAADSVVLMVAGIPLDVRALAPPPENPSPLPRSPRRSGPSRLGSCSGTRAGRGAPEEGA